MFTRVLGLALIIGIIGVSSAQASAQKDLKSARDHEKMAFILVTEPGAAGDDQARDLIRGTMKQFKNSTLVELNRSDPENSELVAQFRLAGAPVPLILLATAKGVIAGGLPAAQATAEGLVALIPSPKKAEILLALQEGKAVFLTASRKGMKTESGAMSSCAMACSQMSGKSANVRIDLDDPKEATLLSQLKIYPAATEPVTMVINPQGQITGTYTGPVEVASLVQAANKKGGGCAPGACGPGSGKTCTPAK